MEIRRFLRALQRDARRLPWWFPFVYIWLFALFASAGQR